VKYDLLISPGCKILFVEEKYGHHDNSDLLFELDRYSLNEEGLERVIVLRGAFSGFLTYHKVMEKSSSDVFEDAFQSARRSTHTHDVVNLEYTSGSTGYPKAAMLAHQYVVTPLQRNSKHAS
jgi:acyl-coenzyme A synthetase/AMP-(fatty) acid ligase